MTERVEGATFAEQTVRLDGRGFVSCTFDACSIVYEGGPTELLDCTFTDCVWRLEGRAANTVTLLGGLEASDGSDGQRLVAGLFSRLRRMRGEPASISDQTSTPGRVDLRAADEVRIEDVTITTITDGMPTDRPREGGSPVADEVPNGETRRQAPSGGWIYASGDLAWIVIAAGVALATVVLGRTGG